MVSPGTVSKKILELFYKKLIWYIFNTYIFQGLIHKIKKILKTDLTQSKNVPNIFYSKSKFIYFCLKTKIQTFFYISLTDLVHLIKCFQKVFKSFRKRFLDLFRRNIVWLEESARIFLHFRILFLYSTSLCF